MTIGRDGKPVLRLLNCGPEMLAPCRNDKGCPKGTPENPRTLNDQNRRCYEHYKECRAVGQFPDDPVVKQNAAVIRDVEDSIERSREVEFQTSLIEILAIKG